MKLNAKGLAHKAQWESKGYDLPKFDREAVTNATKENPFWIHFGPGNIFRAFQANVVQRLLNDGILDRGIVVAEGYDYEIVEKMNHPHDDYNLLVTLKADGNVEKTVIGSVVESLTVNSENATDWNRLKEIFAKDSLQMVSFTITEKGYSLVNGKGELLPGVEDDFTGGPAKAMSYMGKVSALLYARYEAGQKPVAMVSMDNCSHNGDKLFAAVNTFAEKWVANGVAEAGFVAYVNDKNKVSFPWTMIDKITPRPDASVEAILKADGVEELEPVITSKNTYVAPFVNAEECEYLVIEEAFPNGKPAELAKAGVMFTERETVDKVEKMKVCTCLNPLHTALAVYGCVLGYEKISEEMKDDELRKMVERIGYVEGLPVVVNPGVLDPKEFIDTVLNVRIPNPFMPDTPQRIATDTSQKLAIRFGETIKAYEKAGLDVQSLQMIPLVFAGWLRYLMAVDDHGESFELSPDPLLDTVCPYVAGLELKEGQDMEGAVAPVLRMKNIFGVDLYEAGLAEKVISYLTELTAGVGAVRATLKKYV